jgi:hypothetical protein
LIADIFVRKKSEKNENVKTAATRARRDKREAISFHGLFAIIFAIPRPICFQSINMLLTAPLACPSSLYGLEINRSVPS